MRLNEPLDRNLGTSITRGLVLLTLVNGAIEIFRSEAQAVVPDLSAQTLPLEKLDKPETGGMDLPDGIGMELQEIFGSTQWIVDEAGKQLETRFGKVKGKFVVIDGERQVLIIADPASESNGHAPVIWAYPISTGKKGFGTEPDSGKTPSGVFILNAIDGVGGDVGVIRDREGYGERITDFKKGGAKATMTTRFISMQGLDVANKNTASRSIGIHGTNREGSVAAQKPDSGGCVRMDNSAILVLAGIVSGANTNYGKGPYLVVVPPNDPHYKVPESLKFTKIDLRPKPGEEEIWGGWSDQQSE